MEFILYKYDNFFDKNLLEIKKIKITRKCQFVAKNYLFKKYIINGKFDFLEYK